MIMATLVMNSQGKPRITKFYENGEVFVNDGWEAKFKDTRIWLIDHMVAYALKSEGGYVWAYKNYDGDAHRGLLDGNTNLQEFVEKLETTCVSVVDSGKMTKDLAILTHGPKVTKKDYLRTEEFIDAVAEELESKL